MLLDILPCLGILGWINIISTSPVSCGGHLSTGPSAPNILEGHLPYSLPPGMFIPRHLNLLRACPIFKGLRRRGFFKEMGWQSFVLCSIPSGANQLGVWSPWCLPGSLLPRRTELLSEIIVNPVHHRGFLFVFCFDIFFQQRNCFCSQNKAEHWDTGGDSQKSWWLRALEQYFPSFLFSLAAQHQWPIFTHMEVTVTFHYTLHQCILQIWHSTFSVSSGQSGNVSSSVLSLCRRN